MAMKILTPSEVQQRMIHRLGLDKSIFDLTTVEGISAAIRRAAGFHCPCSPNTLVRAVLQPLEGLVENYESMKDIIENTHNYFEMKYNRGQKYPLSSIAIRELNENADEIKKFAAHWNSHRGRGSSCNPLQNKHLHCPSCNSAGNPRHIPQKYLFLH